MIQKLISFAEKGMLPDFLIRKGIRRLNLKRLSIVKGNGVKNTEELHQKWVDELKASPIALVPEKANEQHYEVPPEFFEQVLGKHLKYSSGYWPVGTQSLDSSETAMLETTFQRAELKDGMQILELGCGWGSLTCFMAQQLPNAQITAVSNSSDQRKFIQKRCEKNGLTNIEVITADMNNFNTDKIFDRVVSVEMFEHMRNYGELLKRISSFTVADGKIFIHIFSHKTLAYPFEDHGPGDWMAREFFSGGQMPSHRLLLHFQDHVKIEKVWRFSGNHYSKTSRAWLNQMDKNKKIILDIFSKTYGDDNAKMWFQRWRIFFMACEELFGMNYGTEWGVSHFLFINKNLIGE